MAGVVFQLRQRWQGLFLRRIRFPFKPRSQMDEEIIQTLVSVLSAEEQASGLQQPTGIGQRPKPMFCSEFTEPSSWRSTDSPRSLLDPEQSEEATGASRQAFLQHSQ